MPVLMPMRAVMRLRIWMLKGSCPLLVMAEINQRRKTRAVSPRPCLIRLLAGWGESFEGARRAVM